MGLYEKMYQVMCDTEEVKKDLVVGTGNNSYKAIGEKEVLNMLKPLFKKYKLIVFPIDGEITEQNSIYESTFKNEVTTKTRNVTQLKVKYKIVDIETGENETIIGFGNGADSQDKGSGKAFTYSFKVALSKTFMLFSGEDTDNTHSDDIDKAPQKLQEKQKQQGNTNTPTTDNITTQMLIDMAKSKGFTEEQICKKYKVTEVKFIKKDDKKAAYENFKKLPNKEVK